VDYSVWTALQKMEYHNEISDTNQLKRKLIDCWTQLKTGFMEPSNQSAAKKVMMIMKVNGAEFSVDQFCVQLITAATFVTFSSKKKLGEIHAYLSNSA